MLVVNPETIGEWGERKLMSGFLQCQQAKITQALNASDQAVTQDALAQAVRFLKTFTGVSLSEAQLSQLLDLYPFARSKLAENGWQQPECEQVVLDVLANSLLCSRWPTQLDQTNFEVFTGNLRFAAKEFGYQTI